MFKIQQFFVLTKREAKMIEKILRDAARTSKDPHVFIFATRYAERIQRALNEEPKKL